MGEAFGWGLLAASSLLVGGILALRLPINRRVVGLVMAFGAGVLISAVAFELVEEAFETSAGSSGVFLGLFAGCAVFFVGDELIDRLGGHERKSMMGVQAEGSPLAIVLGTVLDGIPESAVLGMTILEAGQPGSLVETGPTSSIFDQPTNEVTGAYVSAARAFLK